MAASQRSGQMKIPILMRKAGLLLLFAVAAYGASSKAKELLDKADQLHKAGDSAGAFQAYVEAVKIDPSVESWDLIDRGYGNVIGTHLDPAQEKRALAAAPYVQEALRLYLSRHPDKYSAIFLLTQSYTFTGQPGEAERLWNAYLSRRPRNVKAFYDRDEVLEAEGKDSDVLAAHEHLVVLYPCDEHALADLAGRILASASRASNLTPERRRTMIDRAEAATRRALAPKPDYLGAMHEMRDVLRAKAKLENDPNRAAALNKEADAMGARWKVLFHEDMAQLKVGRKWDFAIRQVSEDDPRIGFYSVRGSMAPNLIRREPFLLEILEPTDAPIRVVIAGDDRVARPLPGNAFRSKNKRGDQYVVTYAVESLGGVPIADVKDCRLYITVTRGNESFTLMAQPE